MAKSVAPFYCFGYQRSALLKNSIAVGSRRTPINCQSVLCPCPAAPTPAYVRAAAQGVSPFSHNLHLNGDKNVIQISNSRLAPRKKRREGVKGRRTALKPNSTGRCWTALMMPHRTHAPGRAVEGGRAAATHSYDLRKMQI